MGGARTVLRVCQKAEAVSASEVFWAKHQVGGPYHTIEESAWALRDRLRQFPLLLDLMLVNHPGKKVLDYGCGPGHDSILISQLGAYLTYWDTSERALLETRRRLQLHGLPGRLFDGVGEYDHIHCAGVLHHTENPQEILHQFYELLAPGGEVRLMIYDGETSQHSQSDVPITHWWTSED